eukprot:CAMPEP_0180607222 /NCGR_PEP_ID=MMETSP1037_2-20121125/27589_1 /TAXON_ID=632150 /ORGANISM="Azadinium spinosum, Strain 3D9" /LENGTH=181 /DNA_ID=CAMNT_0022626495 /DNA_START=13 /DNA_END=554 /DNA_ORIENTATION=-
MSELVAMDVRGSAVSSMSELIAMDAREGLVSTLDSLPMDAKMKAMEEEENEVYVSTGEVYDKTDILKAPDTAEEIPMASPSSDITYDYESVDEEASILESDFTPMIQALPGLRTQGDADAWMQGLDAEDVEELLSTRLAFGLPFCRPVEAISHHASHSLAISLLRRPLQGDVQAEHARHFP